MTATACLRGTTCHCAETDQCVWSRPLCLQESDMKRARLLTAMGPRVRREGDFDWLYTSRSCTTEAVAAQHLKTKQNVPPSPGGAPSCVASWRCAWPPSRGRKPLAPAARAVARPCARCARVAQKWSGALAVRDGTGVVL